MARQISVIESDRVSTYNTLSPAAAAARISRRTLSDAYWRGYVPFRRPSGNTTDDHAEGEATFDNTVTTDWALMTARNEIAHNSGSAVFMDDLPEIQNPSANARRLACLILEACVARNQLKHTRDDPLVTFSDPDAAQIASLLMDNGCDVLALWVSTETGDVTACVVPPARLRRQLSKLAVSVAAMLAGAPAARGHSNAKPLLTTLTEVGVLTDIGDVGEHTSVATVTPGPVPSILLPQSGWTDETSSAQTIRRTSGIAPVHSREPVDWALNALTPPDPRGGIGLRELSLQFLTDTFTRFGELQGAELTVPAEVADNIDTTLRGIGLPHIADSLQVTRTPTLPEYRVKKTRPQKRPHVGSSLTTEQETLLNQLVAQAPQGEEPFTVHVTENQVDALAVLSRQSFIARRWNNRDTMTMVVRILPDGRDHAIGRTHTDE